MSGSPAFRVQRDVSHSILPRNDTAGIAPVRVACGLDKAPVLCYHATRERVLLEEAR